MEQRELGRTGRNVGVIGLGAWQLGADWGDVSEDDALATLTAAVDAGVTFIDTADVYGDGRSEQIVAKLIKERPGLTVATKMGRRVAQEPSAYTLDNFRKWNDRSRANLGVDTIDLVQLHCPPTPVYSTDAVFDALDTMVEEGRLAAYGVSVETCEEALTAIARPNVASVQIILNALRLKPLEQVLPAAQKAGVGIIARVPLASGLLSGKYDEHTTFGQDDHRNFNRHGESFDVGETFSGVEYEHRPPGRAQASAVRAGGDDHGAVRAALDRRPARCQRGHPRGAQRRTGPGQRRRGRGRPSAGEALAGVMDVYDELIRPQVHHRW